MRWQIDWWEFAANAMNTTSIVLAARNSVHLWWTGIIGSTLFGYVFYRSQLYADSSLQLFFVVTSVIGWKAWVRSKGQPALPVTSTSARQLMLMSAGAIPAVVAYGFLLHRWTDAYAPFVDAVVVGTSVVATFLLMYRRIETWPVWLIVNTVSVPLFWSRGLRITAVLYAIYWVNAWIGWRHWLRERLGDVSVNR